MTVDLLSDLKISSDKKEVQHKHLSPTTTSFNPLIVVRSKPFFLERIIGQWGLLVHDPGNAVYAVLHSLNSGMNTS